MSHLRLGQHRRRSRNHAAEDRAYALLDEAVAAGAVERTGAGYRFRHSLVRDALLDGLPPHQLLPLRRQAATVLEELGASPARIGHQLLQAGDLGPAAPFLLQAVRAEAAVGAYCDALSLIDTVRIDIRGPERAPLLALRADMLMATGDAGAVPAYREAWLQPTNPLRGASCYHGSRGRPSLPETTRRPLMLSTGLSPMGPPTMPRCSLPAETWAYFNGDLAGAEAAADEARRRLALADLGDWRLYDLITLQGLIAHLRGE